MQVNAAGKHMNMNRWTNTHSGNELGRHMFADAARADREANCFLFCGLFESRKQTVCPQHHSTPTYTERLTFQSMVAKAVMVGCKTSFCQSVHMKINITLLGEFVFVTKLL